MKKLLLLSSLCLCFSRVFPASIEDLDDFPKACVLEFLNPDDLQSVRRTSKYFESLLGKGSYIRSHMFDVTLDDDDATKMTLSSYLRGEQRRPISEVKNIVTLIKDSPNTFIRIMLKTVPHAYETIFDDLRSFYNNGFKDICLANSIPKYKTPRQKLAGLIIELLIWAQIGVEVSNQVGAQFATEVRNQVGIQLGDQVRFNLWDQVKAQGSSQISNQVWSQFGLQVRTMLRLQIRGQVWAQVRDLVRNQVNEDLRHFQLASASQVADQRETLNRAISYTSVVYQLGTLAMRYSSEFQSIHKRFLQSISQISEEQASSILEDLHIPNTRGNYLVDTQLELIELILKP